MTSRRSATRTWSARAASVAYESGRSTTSSYSADGVAQARSGLPRGTEYTAWGYTPQPKPAQLAKSPATTRARSPTRALPAAPARAASSRPFGTPEHTSGRARSPIRPSRAALPTRSTVGRHGSPARRTNPYAAAVAIEAWFRSGGGFVYDEQPPPVRGTPPLVGFVTRTQARLLPALRGRDGAHAPLSGDSRPGRRRLLERRLTTTGATSTGRSTTAMRTRGSRCGSRATAGCRSTRPRPRARSAARTRPPRRASTRPGASRF